MKAALLLAGIMLGAASIVAPRKATAKGDEQVLIPSRERDVPRAPNELTGLALVADRARFVDPFAGEAFATLN